MSSIDIRNFVDVNIVRRVPSTISGTRDTAILFTDEARLDGHDDPITEEFLVTSKTEAQNLFEDVLPHTYQYCEIYFNNGGKRLAIYTNIDADESVSDNRTLAMKMQDKLKDISNDYICVAYAPVAAWSDTVTNTMLELADRLSENNGIDQKIVFARTNQTAKIEISYTIDPSATSPITKTVSSIATKNFAVKYAEDRDLTDAIDDGLGVEMSMLAYLSKINVYTIDSVYDYMFTIEKVKAQDQLTDADYKDIIKNNYNVDITLANEIRNCGGNCTNSEDLVNEFVLIVLQQTITNVVVDALAKKLKNQSGINTIYSVVNAELEKYKNSGYLTTDKIWHYDDLYYTWNGIDYLIIQKGTPLQNGYFVKILPYSGLNEDEKIERKAPPVYIIIAEQYGIRKIQIEGEAF